MAVYARQAKNRDLEADAVEIWLRAERRAGELLTEMEKNQARSQERAPVASRRPVLTKPKLSDFGVSKTQSAAGKRSRPSRKTMFASVVAATRRRPPPGWMRPPRGSRSSRARELRRPHRKAARSLTSNRWRRSGRSSGVICPDFPWRLRPYSEQGQAVLSAERLLRDGPPERQLDDGSHHQHWRPPTARCCLGGLDPTARRNSNSSSMWLRVQDNGLPWLKTTRQRRRL